MSDMSLPVLVLILATFFAAGAVKGVTGMGLPTVAMGVLGALISPLTAASLLIVPSFFTNLWQLLAGPALRPVLRRFWPMMLAICAGTVPGAAWLAGGNAGVARTLLGAALVIYAGYSLLARQLSVPSRIEPVLSPVIGGLTGMVSGATGVFVIPAVPYLQALGLSKDDLVQALGLSFTVSTVALALALGAHGAFSAGMMGLSLLALGPALIGMWAGQKLRNRISLATFRKVFLGFLLLLGAEMALRQVL
ncbi:sulfite exporter TauE/SafE family protein [Paenirhodobacter populi]|uniref:Probable membrane transporter protein n=1 Tax=Paenirhodobacter populi TaxID=2306993 RepID=A0A443J6F7_9RHOB|nr:sulfite exporter TauE/SafE family protein [Sinirhodobacter populi]RWR16133.1 sulfite exporter TauE/SafE family protein [Sinirhodobacter populi]